MRLHPVERLRKIWTPGREIEEIVANLEPQTELDSMLRDWIMRILIQKGPMTLDLDKLNTGTMRWEIIHHEITPGVVGRREVSLWMEN